MTKNDLKGFAIIAIAIILVAGIALAAVKYRPGAQAKPLTTEQKLQRFLDKAATKQVASIEVVKCDNVGKQTVEGVTYDALLACPTKLVLKNGQGGCIGVLATALNDGRVVAIAAPQAIDAKYCA